MSVPRPKFEYWREILLLALMVAVLLLDTFFLKSFRAEPRPEGGEARVVETVP
ncbi:hypothetical protein [Salidesulfovibrio onnuriiensis]|uniref:hypothetical protein n=1 Tax=Salidesulfovibrio onnuriiensis TaxID=2583823 RepID=UPI00164F9732|nr:hypothetical protein [Salidesulfovibrio onnuriiensis]